MKRLYNSKIVHEGSNTQADYWRLEGEIHHNGDIYLLSSDSYGFLYYTKKDIKKYLLRLYREGSLHYNLY